MITLRQLTYLNALDEHQNFTRAAASVPVSQSALSQQIKELETNLGAPLLARIGKGFAFTPLGRDILARAAKITALVEEIEIAARQSHAMPENLTVGVIPTVAPYVLPHALRQLRDTMSGCHFQIREGLTDLLVEDLGQGRIDMAVLALPAPIDGLDEEVLFTDHFVLVGDLDGIAKLPLNMQAQEIDADSLLLLDEGHCLSGQVLDACHIRNSAAVDLRASSMATLCRLAAEGMGLTMVPEIALRTEVQAIPGLKAKRFARQTPMRSIGLVRRSLGARPDWFRWVAEAFAQAGHLAKQ
ncbi:MAG: LysR substrate-binding domain-containing protein [Pseudomonadota bacterium]